MDLARARVAVTGATGFLGRYLVDALEKHGATVVGVVRSPDKVPELAARIEMRRADLADRAALRRGFEGVDAVVSNAALLSLGLTDWDSFRHTNVEGCENVFAAAHEAGVERLVHMSSVVVYRGRLFGGPVEEERPRIRARTRPWPWQRYAASKALAEEAAWQAAERFGQALTVFRPAAVFGAFDGTLTRIVRRWIRPPLTILPVGCPLSLVYGGDVAEAVALSLARPHSAGRAYNLGLPGTAWGFARSLAEAGFPAARVWLPIPFPFGMSRYSVERARSELAWTPLAQAEALRETRALEAGGRGTANGG